MICNEKCDSEPCEQFSEPCEQFDLDRIASEVYIDNLIERGRIQFYKEFFTMIGDD
jgi:hypothetical protein